MNFFQKLKDTTLLNAHQKPNQQLAIILELMSVVGIGVLDYLTGYEVAFSLFYVAPITMATWFVNRRHGIFTSCASALVWLWADVASGHFYPHPFIPIWNSLIRFSFFSIIVMLLSALRNALEHEKTLARTDFLTGAVNSRLFYELVQREIDRCKRYNHTFSLVYLDLDNFKTINDTFGHDEGDLVLHTIVNFTKKNIRATDVIARIGGDEFSLLLPETDQEAAQKVVLKLQSGLLDIMQRNKWDVTFSVGVLTCVMPPQSTSEIIKIADKLMYSVKRSGKNAITFAMYSG